MRVGTWSRGKSGPSRILFTSSVVVNFLVVSSSANFLSAHIRAEVKDLSPGLGVVEAEEVAARYSKDLNVYTKLNNCIQID
jgi:hypothetical protein